MSAKVFSIICILMSGCASMASHEDSHIGFYNAGEFGHPYSGFQTSLTTAPCNLALSGTVLFVFAPFIIIDIPLSLVADTFLLPWDIAVEPTKPRDEVVVSVSEYCSRMSKSMSGPQDDG